MSPDSKPRLFLLDGMAIAYRAHFAFINSRLTSPDGKPTGPILGFANTLEKLLEEEKPTHIAVAWDTHAPTFRHEIDSEYKANRPPQPEELRIGIPIIKDMVERFGIRNLELDGFEADDIIGTLADKANAQDVDVWLVTPDKDFMQLVHDHIRMLKPDNANGGFQRIGPEEVKDYFGVYPAKVVDVLAIIGDASDNIPGVPGIGKKGAPQLIERFGSLEEAIANASQITAKRQREGLTEHADTAMQAKRMVTIHTDVPGIPHWTDLGWDGADRRRLAELFESLAFRTLTRKYGGEPAVAPASSGSGSPNGQGGLFDMPAKTDPGDSAGSDPADSALRHGDLKVTYRSAVTPEQIDQMVQELSGFPRICLDTETDSADPIRAALVGLSFCAEPGTAWYVPVNHPDGLPPEKVIERLSPLLGRDQVQWVAQNLKFDWLVLDRHGAAPDGRVFDTMVAAYLLDSDQKLNMEALSLRYLGYRPIPIERLIGKGRTQISMAEVPPESVRDYACEDADVTLRLADALTPGLDRDGLAKLAEEVDFPLVPVLGRMERHGVRIDEPMLKEFSGKLEREMLAIRGRIAELAGTEFNIQSPQQLGEVLFERLNLPTGRKTRTGKYSTSEEVLQGLAPMHPLPALILDYRSLAKLRSTYADALPGLVNPETGRVHTSFNQTVAATGRLSSSNPNLQNIPIRTPLGREIRKAFIAGDGFRILSADYSQVELRIIASMSGDVAMIEAFRSGQDIHARTAMEIFGLDSPDEVTPDHRRKAKEVNFGIPYGVSAFGLASRLGISNGEGKGMIQTYFDRFPGVRRYIEQTVRSAGETGYVKTMLGRRRYIRDIRSGNANARGFAERTAINMPIQGTAADVIKLAMIAIDRDLRAMGARSRMLLQVHDELVFEVHESELETVPPLVKERMEQAVRLEVPLDVEMGVGANWLEAH